MRRQPIAGPTEKIAYALGTALVFVPLVGIPARFAVQEIPPTLVYVGAFLIGMLTGWLFAPRRERVENN